MIEASGVLRSWEIEVSSAARSRSVSAVRSTAVHVLDEADALDGERGLVHQRVEQAALVGGQQRARACRCRCRRRRWRRGRCASAGTAAWRRAACRSRGRRRGRSPRSISPRRDRPRRACPPADSRPCTAIEPLLRQQQHDAHFEHQRDLIGGRPQHVVERAGAGELAAEGIERRRRRGRGLAPPRSACGFAPRDCETMTATMVNSAKAAMLCGSAIVKRVDRRQEEEIIGERRDDAGKQRRQQAEAHGDADDRGEEHQIDVLDADPIIRPARRSRARWRPRAARDIGTGIEDCRARRDVSTLFFGIAPPGS